MSTDLVDIRRELHRFPEIGLSLPRTQDLVCSVLSDAGLSPIRGRGCSSVTAVLRGSGSGPVVLLRADMDALPVTETAAVGYRSEVPGAMHACGHDLHTAALLGAARDLAARRDSLPGDVIFMFQPGEEGCDGAKVMLAEGVLDAAGRRPDAAWAVHVTSNLVPPGVWASRPGPLMAASTMVQVTVRGTGGHAGAPHLAVDPVLPAAEMVTGLYGRVFRSSSPFEPVVVSVGEFHAGTRPNIIPGEATFSLTLRCFGAAVLAALEQQVVDYCRSVGSAYGVSVDVSVVPRYPVTINDPSMIESATATVTSLFGEESWAPLADPLATSEDFANVLNEVPGAMIMFGTGPAGSDWRDAPVNHAPDVVFDDTGLDDMAALYAGLALRTVQR